MFHKKIICPHNREEMCLKTSGLHKPYLTKPMRSTAFVLKAFLLNLQNKHSGNVSKKIFEKLYFHINVHPSLKKNNQNEMKVLAQ